jgi:hypothetical protein
MKPWRSSILLVTGMLLALAACSVPSASGTVSTQGNPSPLPPQTTSLPTASGGGSSGGSSASSGACTNSYFPTTPGATWTYANTSPMAPDSTTTQTLTNIGPAGFTVNDAITPDITMTVNWSCQGGNLTMLDSATLSSGSTVIAISSVSASGYLIPAAIKAGDTWSEKLSLVGTGEIDGTTRATQQNETQVACTANGLESVQVQAGTFNAMKVTCVYAITTTTQVDATPGVPVNNSITITDWYVAGVGSVKTEKSGDIIETHELTSYSIP